eukprot:2189154-Lingulodinium_polyedra.AAC.1
MSPGGPAVPPPALATPPRGARLAAEETKMQAFLPSVRQRLVEEVRAEHPEWEPGAVANRVRQ